MLRGINRGERNWRAIAQHENACLSSSKWNDVAPSRGGSCRARPGVNGAASVFNAGQRPQRSSPGIWRLRRDLDSPSGCRLSASAALVCHDEGPGFQLAEILVESRVNPEDEFNNPASTHTPWLPIVFAQTLPGIGGPRGSPHALSAKEL
jgi:hypothetical protein